MTNRGRSVGWTLPVVVKHAFPRRHLGPRGIIHLSVAALQPSAGQATIGGHAGTADHRRTASEVATCRVLLNKEEPTPLSVGLQASVRGASGVWLTPLPPPNCDSCLPFAMPIGGCHANATKMVCCRHSIHLLQLWLIA